jgi:hypothetical protein
MKIYEVTHRGTKESFIINADSKQDACKALGWYIAECHVDFLEPEEKEVA